MKILVIDDHPLIQEALRQVLRDLDERLVLLQAGQRQEALEQLKCHPDTALILLDLALPGVPGSALLSELRELYPDVPIVMLSATHDRATVTSALDAGAMGFIPKTSSPRVLIGALKLILAGAVYLPHDIIENGASAISVPDSGSARAVSSTELGLTNRQFEVLSLLVQGKPNKLICRDLRLSEGTVKVHVSAILRALDVHTRTQAVIELSRRGVQFNLARAVAA